VGTNRTAALARRFDALVFDWDGTAVPGREADASAVRGAVEALGATGMHVAIVSGTHLGNVDGQLQARPVGPGRLLLALNRGSELFEVDRDGPRLLARRDATPEEDDALTRAAEKVVSRLAARGLDARIVSQRLNRRKIDLIPLPEWADPPKAVIGELLRAVEARLTGAGFSGIAEVVELAMRIAREEGLAAPKITSDAKHVEIGLTDKSDAARAVLDELWACGIAPPLVCFGGDEFGPLGALPGSDALMLVPEAAGATVVSVGVEPNGVPEGVVHLRGGPAGFASLLADQLRRRSDLREVPRVAALDEWSLTVDGIDPETERARSALLTLSDGRIGTTGAPLLHHAATDPEVLAAGVYEGEGPLTDLVPAPRWTRLARDLAPGDHVRRVLDLHTATLAEHVTGATRVASIRFVSAARPGVAVLRARVEPPVEGPPLHAPPHGFTYGQHNDHDWMATRGSGGSVTTAAVERRDGPHLERVAAYVVSPGGPTPEAAGQLLAAAERAGFETLLAEHRRAWARRWEDADVRIAGDAGLQRAVRVALFHLMGAAGDAGEAAVGARGLTGRAYRGHVFWDADLFVLPFLAATHPASARAMLEYRVRRLPAALARAAAEGRSGARFPWESARTGGDVTPHAGRDQSGRVVPIRTGDEEIHIVGDVAWGASCYIDWTGDEEFAAGAGRDLLVATARYWASRLRVDATGHAHIYGVIGPDEYHEPVDDNAYTNVLARWNLRRAAEAAGRYGGAGDAERDAWCRLADALVDGYDAATGRYEQFAGFFELEPLRIADVAPRRPITADLLLGRDRVRQAQVVKQADVLMLHHLLPDEVAPASLEPNLDYYEPRTAHGSSLSPAIHASVLARAGRFDAALDALRLAVNIDLDDLTRTGAGGVHLAAMGGVWQALAFGFMGLRAHRDAVEVDPKVPDAWDSLEIRVRYHGTPVALRASHESLHVRAGDAVSLRLCGRTVACGPGDTEFPLRDRRLR
jgi:trehalose/maltose hydrolase-like predicted phosphorylase